mmetsp:Transcript_7539/g.13647  ORF Transcript_7539/g.13647 Transcript_7539/m.13647 type:complete len:494 (-) Transcript_7539:328-1809(-)
MSSPNVAPVQIVSSSLPDHTSQMTKSSPLDAPLPASPSPHLLSASAHQLTNGVHAGRDVEEDQGSFFFVHLETKEIAEGSSPSRRGLVLSIREREIEDVAVATSPLIQAPGTPSNDWHPEAMASTLVEDIMWDSFQLDLPEEKIESRLQRVRAELSDYDIDQIEEAVEIENLLETEAASRESAFYLVDLGTVVRKYEQWVTLLPNVKPYYAVKSNPDRAIIRTLKAIGTGFDCASQAELEQVLALGVPPGNIIFANPCKMNAHIMFAKKHQVRKMTFDNLDELQKIHTLYPDAELILRLLPPDASSALCNFGSKFGANKKMTRSLIKAAAKLRANFCGVSFHVGSGCWDPRAYEQALELAHEVCKYSTEEFGFQMKYVDIGGGYPAADDLNSVSFPVICESLSPAINRLFPPESGIELIAEPGRYFCGEAVVLAVNIIAKRVRVPAESTLVDDESENDDDAVGNEPSKTASTAAETEAEEEEEEEEAEFDLFD